MKNQFFQLSTFLLLLAIGVVSCGDANSSNKNETLNSMQQKDAVVNIANAAFTYGLPLVLLDITQSQLVPFSDTKRPLLNTFLNKHQFPSSSDTSVVRPNADTYYSIAWLNLTGGPLLMTLPETDSNYFQMPMLDGFTNVFQSPGTRTYQTQGGTYVITGTNESIAPQNVADTINAVAHYKCNTDMSWVLGRFEVDNSEDSITVRKLQRQLRLKPLGKRIDYQNPVYDYGSSKPNDVVKGMDINTFFNRMNALLINNPPTEADSTIVASMKKIGVGAGLTFNSANFPKVENILNKIPSMKMSFYQKITASSTPISDTCNWTVNLDTLMGNYGTNYDLRAVIAYAGLGANTVEDAVYYSNYKDTNNDQLNSNYNYKLTFDGGSPPVDAFWSLTMYNEDGYFVENSIDRYAVGHGAPFHYDGPDSILTIYVQSEPPTDQTYYNNWLPSPAGSKTDFNVMLRAYWPEDAILDAHWTPPNIVRTDAN
ncbi:MAG: DUF1254 domain-containing protein [Saprospiraceae bacterium]|nr:DUF1254 domain-containing protein [Saprospiraceae bacterium]